jgi:hypothetical protein
MISSSTLAESANVLFGYSRSGSRWRGIINTHHCGDQS